MIVWLKDFIRRVRGLERQWAYWGKLINSCLYANKNKCGIHSSESLDCVDYVSGFTLKLTGRSSCTPATSWTTNGGYVNETLLSFFVGGNFSLGVHWNSSSACFHHCETHISPLATPLKESRHRFHLYPSQWPASCRHSHWVAVRSLTGLLSWPLHENCRKSYPISKDEI